MHIHPAIHISVQINSSNALWSCSDAHVPIVGTWTGVSMGTLTDLWLCSPLCSKLWSTVYFDLFLSEPTLTSLTISATEARLSSSCYSHRGHSSLSSGPLISNPGTESKYNPAHSYFPWAVSSCSTSWFRFSRCSVCLSSCVTPPSDSAVSVTPHLGSSTTKRSLLCHRVTMIAEGGIILGYFLLFFFGLSIKRLLFTVSVYTSNNKPKQNFVDIFLSFHEFVTEAFGELSFSLALHSIGPKVCR